MNNPVHGILQDLSLANQAQTATAAGPGQNPLNNMRQRLFHILFVRFATAYARLLRPSYRRVIEFAVFIEALFCMSTLIYLHVAFNRTQVSCLENIRPLWPRDGVLRVKITKNNFVCSSDMAQNNCYHRSHIEWNGMTDDSVETYSETFRFASFNSSDHQQSRYLNFNGMCMRYVPFVIHNHSSVCHRYASDSVNLSSNAGFEVGARQRRQQHVHFSGMLSWISMLADFFFVLDDYAESDQNEEMAMIEYATEFGYLRLSPATRQRLGISVMTVYLNPDDDSCFGSNISRWLLDRFLGYDDILMSSVKALAEHEQKSSDLGYVRNVLTGEHYKFVAMSTSRVSYIAALFIMLIFTFSISMLLRYSHHQIFSFIVEFLHMLEMNAAVAFPAAPMLTVILALVGMEAIMSEFFLNDTSTVFYVILLVWIADQYVAVCCHSSISKRHWLKFFYLYHFAFYAYHYRFNGQYGGLALLTSILFIQHSMIYFFHHFELPLIQQQQQLQNFIQTLQHSRRHVINHSVAAMPHASASNAAPVAVHSDRNHPGSSEAASFGFTVGNNREPRQFDLDKTVGEVVDDVVNEVVANQDRSQTGDTCTDMTATAAEQHHHIAASSG